MHIVADIERVWVPVRRFCWQSADKHSNKNKCLVVVVVDMNDTSVTSKLCRTASGFIAPYR